jgi:hypothetical protein
MGLVHQLDLEGMPEIYIFYCTSCQLAQTVKQERAQKISQIIETADAQLRNASSRSGGLTSDRA